MTDTLASDHLKQAEQDIKNLQDSFDSIFELNKALFSSIKNMEQRIIGLEKIHSLFTLVATGFMIALAFLFFMM